MTNEDRVVVSVTDHIAQVRLARPEKHNALDLVMFEALAGAAARLAGERGVRVVVVHGEGPSFCSGIDLASLMGLADGVGAVIDGVEDGQVANLFQRVATDWARVPVPVIAAIHGACFGGGMQIALGADIRIAAPDARLSIMEMRWGLIPDMGITATLPGLVGPDVAKELTLTARVLDGEAARAAGLVTRVADDPLAAALELAGDVASRSPEAVRGVKRLYDTTWRGPSQAGLALEREIQKGLIGSPNQMAAVMAGLAKETPVFTDPG